MIRVHDSRLALLACCLLALGGCDLLSGPESRIERAEKAIAAGDYGAAMVDLRNALDKSPTNARALQALASLSLQSGDLEGAAGAVDRAAAAGVDPRRVAGYRTRLLAYRGEWQRLLDAIGDGSLGLDADEASLYRAQALYGLGKPTEARQEFQKLLARQPDNVVATVGLADSLALGGNLPEARKRLQELVGRHPESAEAWMAHGSLLARMGEMDAAESALQSAMKLARGQLTAPQHTALIGSLADRSLFKGDVAQVQRLYDEMVKVSAQSVPARLLDARIAIANGKPEDAKRAMQAVVTNNPLVAGPRMLLVSAFLAEQNMQQALQQIEELAAQAPTNNTYKVAVATVKAAAAAEADSAKRWTAIGAAQLMLDQPAAARTALKSAVARDPGSFSAASGLVTLDVRSGQLEAALSGARQLREKFPDERAGMKLLGDVHLARKEYRDADDAYAAAWRAKHDVTMALARSNARKLGALGGVLEPLNEWLQAHPADASVRLLLAEELLAAGDRTRAIAEYERVVRDAPGNAIALNNLGLLYSQAGDARALAMAKRAYGLAPTRPAVADTYGWLLVQRGSSAEGLAILETAHAGAAADHEIGYHHAAALVATGQKAKAKKALQELLESGIEFPSRKAAEQLLGRM